MSRILVTGMSGTGKSSAIAELARRGYRAVDTDDPGWREYRPYVEPSDELHRDEIAERDEDLDDEADEADDTALEPGDGEAAAPASPVSALGAERSAAP